MKVKCQGVKPMGGAFGSSKGLFTLSVNVNAAMTLVIAHIDFARFVCIVCIRVGSADPVRVLRLFQNEYIGYN